ncbi:Rpn family recombination-promoting nuclease/putative transposase [Candidatus Magnetaquicoccus inordinatus]|uniref:Rpn family recombination-promoting nuclease/putative transposase n=1 Tax=Candidatus Magnetaquicoccus inordinatus TaxID=2496818 RepID=UPI00102C10E4|nr:Rpn family recombination-promoting nuclease/putative transposase [Candidatus Magnetaquicoccus inordinatus]
MQFIDPRIDFAFKMIFGSEDGKDILISFLESLLGLTGEKRLKEITLLDPFLAPRILGMKSSVLDVRCLDHRGVQYIVEMQVSRVRAFLKRIQYNAAKSYVHQIANAEEYPKLNQVIAITITDFILFPEFVHCVSAHEMRETLSGESLLREILYYFIELPKFDRSWQSLDNLLDKWIYFIRFASSLEEIPATLAEPVLQHAFAKARLAGMNREELEYYDKAAMAVQDARGALELAVEEAEQRGVERGKQEGREEGREEGRQKGTAETLLQLLQLRFGPLPVAIRDKVATAELPALESWIARILQAQSLEELFGQ